MESCAVAGHRDHRCLQRHRRGDRAAARRRHGARLVLVARREERLAALAAELGADASYVATDVTDETAPSGASSITCASVTAASIC